MDNRDPYYNWDESFDLPCHKGALTVGNFDGVHRGHQSLLAELSTQARQLAGPAVVLTFDPHPLKLLRPENSPPLLTTVPQRIQLLHECGADFVLILRTTPDLLRLSARDFFERVIRDKIQPGMIVPGFNFGFGHNREGTVETLAEFCREVGIGFDEVPPAQFAGDTISSSRIRTLLNAGAVTQASELLGRPYSLTGIVDRGQQRGQKIGFPTANLHEVQTLLPADGVYAVRVHLDDKVLAGAANIGSNPTFGEQTRKIEVHVIDFSGDLYGQTLTVDFVERLRDTRPFTGIEALRKQLARDVEQARKRG